MPAVHVPARAALRSNTRVEILVVTDAFFIFCSLVVIDKKLSCNRLRVKLAWFLTFT
jgi:hypothetical protein